MGNVCSQHDKYLSKRKVITIKLNVHNENQNMAKKIPISQCSTKRQSLNTTSDSYQMSLLQPPSLQPFFDQLDSSDDEQFFIECQNNRLPSIIRKMERSNSLTFLDEKASAQ